MTSTDALLEMLGNESRRKILLLLSKKPCYVSEISYLLKMAPKAVIEHLEKLEKAGLIKRFEEGRRRYYRIDKSVRIEITITPHIFETKIMESEEDGDKASFENSESAKLVDKAKDLLEVNVESIEIPELKNTLNKIEQVQSRISEIQGIINRRVTEMFDRIISEINKHIDDEIERIVLIGVAKGSATPLEISELFGIPCRDVEKALKNLQEKGVVKPVKRNGEIVWMLCGIPGYKHH